MDTSERHRRGKEPFDSKERTFQFGVRMGGLANKLPSNIAGVEIARHLIRAGTSIGSTMQDAAAVSKRDFVNGVRISRKEARESRYRLSIIQAAE